MNRDSIPSSKKSHLDTFVLSLDRCLGFEAFIPAFYSAFLSSSDEVAQKFARTDFGKQELKLAQSLRTLAGVMTGDAAALQHLNARAESHDRRHLDIRPELYELWRENLMATAATFDPDWNDYVRESWDSVLSIAIRYMVKRY